jgi:hypothetical protein
MCAMKVLAERAAELISVETLVWGGARNTRTAPLGPARYARRRLVKLVARPSLARYAALSLDRPPRLAGRTRGLGAIPAVRRSRATSSPRRSAVGGEKRPLNELEWADGSGTRIARSVLTARLRHHEAVEKCVNRHRRGRGFSGRIRFDPLRPLLRFVGFLRGGGDQTQHHAQFISLDDILLTPIRNLSQIKSKYMFPC